MHLLLLLLLQPLQVHGYALYKDGQYAPVKYPTDGYSSDVAGRSFHHGCFVQKLRHKAAAQPSVTCRQAFVRGLINGEGMGETLATPSVCLQEGRGGCVGVSPGQAAAAAVFWSDSSCVDDDA